MGWYILMNDDAMKQQNIENATVEMAKNSRDVRNILGIRI